MLSKAVEDSLLGYIRDGKPRELLEYMLKLPEMSIPRGKLTESKLRSLKNTVIIATALASRTAISAGLNYDLACSLCDEYSQQAENRNNYDELLLLITQMVLDFAGRIEIITSFKASCPLVAAVISDVNAHIYEKNSVKFISARLNYSSEHLCRHFRKETGVTLSDYINQQKIAEAKGLLKYTNYSISEISKSLNYSSQSYFQKVFHKVCGITPSQYGKKNNLTNKPPRHPAQAYEYMPPSRGQSKA
ncbi:MAG: AraC family transcriptional regulator [Lachnospiraceae bacterium]|nr:AraC family transcriptional regulator [Lachnospiraceae bacterium]